MDDAYNMAAQRKAFTLVKDTTHTSALCFTSQQSKQYTHSVSSLVR